MNHRTSHHIEHHITSNVHRLYRHKHVENIADVSPVCHRCVWDILNLGVPRRMFCHIQLIRDVRVATIRDTARHNNGTTWPEEKPW